MTAHGIEDQDQEKQEISACRHEQEMKAVSECIKRNRAHEGNHIGEEPVTSLAAPEQVILPELQETDISVCHFIFGQADRVGIFPVQLRVSGMNHMVIHSDSEYK